MQAVTNMLDETFDSLKDEIGEPERMVITIHASLDALVETLTQNIEEGLDSDQVEGLVRGLTQTLNWISDKADRIPTLIERIN